MREKHKESFFEVAERFTCWIGLREPNRLADNWIGRTGAIPKPESCKGKTSDNPSFPFAGLVTDPYLVPDAFKGTLQDAKTAWGKFATGRRLPSGYTVVEEGREKGLVKLNGKFIFADYDLMAICGSSEDGNFLFTRSRSDMAAEKDRKKHYEKLSDLDERSEAEALFEKVKPALNSKFGVDMIQHGAEFMWRKGVGARASEWVYWFGPGHRFDRSLSSMPPKKGKEAQPH
jgi:hypothetical protein